MMARLENRMGWDDRYVESYEYITRQQYHLRREQAAALRELQEETGLNQRAVSDLVDQNQGANSVEQRRQDRMVAEAANAWLRERGRASELIPIPDDPNAEKCTRMTSAN